MREMTRHGAGRLFPLVLLLSTLAMLYIPGRLTESRLMFGWMTPHFVAGIAFLTVWLVAYLVYFFGFWPFRK